MRMAFTKADFLWKASWQWRSALRERMKKPTASISLGKFFFLWEKRDTWKLQLFVRNKYKKNYQSKLVTLCFQRYFASLKKSHRKNQLSRSQRESRKRPIDSNPSLLSNISHRKSGTPLMGDNPLDGQSISWWTGAQGPLSLFSTGIISAKWEKRLS